MHALLSHRNFVDCPVAQCGFAGKLTGSGLYFGLWGPGSLEAVFEYPVHTALHEQERGKADFPKIALPVFFDECLKGEAIRGQGHRGRPGAR